MNLAQSEHQNKQQQQGQLKRLINQEIQYLLVSRHQNQSTEDEQQIYDQCNVYFDKQLTHLVVSEEFDFHKISQILSSVFMYDNIRTSKDVCQMRWAQLHKNRGIMSEYRQKNKENKRVQSIAAFSNPYSLYSVDQLIENLQLHEKQRKHQKKEQMRGQIEYSLGQNVSGYTIFGQSFRKIPKQSAEYKNSHLLMIQAMTRAQSQTPYIQKPMIYTAQYQKSSTFSLKQQQLTQDRARKLIAYQIEMQKINREMTINKKQMQQEQKYQSIIKKKIAQEKRQQCGDFQEDWDAYESD